VRTPGEIVGLIPAAGYATRLQPLTHSKEVLEIGGRPVMSFLVDRMRIAGCSRIRVTTRPEKTDVVALARAEGMQVVLAHPSSVSESIVAALDGLPDAAIAVAGFPDTIWEPVDAFSRLVEAVRARDRVVLGLFATEEPGRCDIVELSPDGKILRIEVKPEQPKTNVTWGIFGARVASLRALATWDEPGRYFDALIAHDALDGIRFPGPYNDVGTPSAASRLAKQYAYDEHGGRKTRFPTTR
jgi:NDP-sugar pyrophosphorylase family protein